ncbi:polysaccharide biosynthesis/export family protein [Planctomycetaceae bacterium SH139]
MYTAASLPAEYHASHHISARHLDLSRVPRAAAPAEWLQPGDGIQVSIATGVEEALVPIWDVALDNDGSVAIPLVGRVPLAGLTPNAAAQRIRDIAVQRGLYVAPNVSVQVDRKRTYQISVVGAVNKPSNYDIPVASCDLLTALSLAEGLALDAETTVEIRHTPLALQSISSLPPTIGPEGPIALASYRQGRPQQPASVIRVDLANLQDIDPASLRLLDGSVVNVTRRTRRLVNVMGLVRNPASLEMPDGEDLTLLAAIAQAGGPTLQLADKVHIVRTPPGTDQPVTIEASLADARNGGPSNLVLAHGDIVNVAETPMTMTVDAIRTFFRVGFTSALPGL